MVFLAFTKQFSLPLTNPVLIFSLILFIILFAPLLLNRLNIPHLIGLIIAGIIIGPHGLNLMNRDSSIILFGTVGLLYIFFLAGIEIDMNAFLKDKWKSLFFGLATFSIPMVMGTFLALHILNFSWPTSVLLASMFASHTLLAYPIISKMGLARNKAVGIAVGGTVITDTLALLVLAIIVAMAHGNMDGIFWWRLGLSFVAAMAFILMVFPLIARWFLKKYHDQVSQYIFFLALVFMGGFLAELAGMEAIIGAFMAGLSLNRLIPRTSPLMSKIEFVGNALFIPFFLIGVGMLIDVRAFTTGTETLKVAAVMIFVAIVAKYLAAWITQKVFRLSVDQRKIIFGLSSAQAAATLAAVLVGYNIILNTEEIQQAALMGQVVAPVRLLNDSVLNATIVMILVTCTLASIQAQKGAQNLALSEENGNTEAERETEEKLLLPVDEVKEIDEAINFALTLKSPKSKSGIYALSVLNSEMDISAESKARKQLENAAKAAASADVFANTLLRYDINPINGIVNVIRENHITDLLFVLNKQEEISERFLNNICDRRITGSNVTLYVYRPAQPIATIKRNLVIIPDKAEKELGFLLWLVKIWNLARNSSARLVFYSTESTYSYLKMVHSRHPIDCEFKRLESWDDFLIISKDIQINDNLIIVMSHRDSPSYNGIMSKIPGYLNRYFTQNSCLLIYPIHKIGEETTDTRFSNPSMRGTMETLDDISKAISSIFRRR